VSFFKSPFKPSRDEVWEALRAQIGGEVVPGTLWHGKKLRADAGGWTVTLDEYAVMVNAGKTTVPIMHTRMRAPFPNSRGFRFSIHRASVFSSIGAMLGMQDIQVRDPAFDEAFVIKGNNEDAVRTLCSSDRLRALVTAQPKFQIRVEDDDGWFGAKYPAGVDVLTFNVAESIRDVERLKGLYDVFAETLDRLAQMGIAGRGSGGVTV
jgi:hypothetical protein